MTDTDPGDSSEVLMIQQPSIWTKGSNESASFTSNADFKDFLYVKVDREIVDESNYDVKEGSTIATFKASYLRLSLQVSMLWKLCLHQVLASTISAFGTIEIKAQAVPN